MIDEPDWNASRYYTAPNTSIDEIGIDDFVVECVLIVTVRMIQDAVARQIDDAMSTSEVTVRPIFPVPFIVYRDRGVPVHVTVKPKEVRSEQPSKL
jgi:hypothetical protein